MKMIERLKEYFNSNNYQPRNYEELFLDLDIGINEASEFKAAIDTLINEHDIFLSKKNRYILPKDANLYKGIITIKNPDYGFISSTSFSDDLYVHKNGLLNAFNKDEVLFSLYDHFKNNSKEFKQEAKIIKIIKRNLNYVVGEVITRKKNFYLDNELEMKIKLNNVGVARSGDIVKARITKYDNSLMEADVAEVIGYKDDAGIDILEIAAKHDFPLRFPDEVIAEVDSFTNDGEIEFKRRKNPSLERIFTIDGDDAKDLDDAVGIKKLENGNLILGVYISDVSYYVGRGTLVNDEAYSRATSVYLVDKVIPMLPPKLSNDLCSLNPNSKKLVIALEIEFNEAGEVVNSEVFESVIVSNYRMTYKNVNLILEGNKELIEEYKEIYNDIILMNSLREVLNDKRNARGALDFDVPEAKIITDEKGIVVDVEVINRGASARMIEEFMLIANEVIATRIYFLDLPFIYRVHESPKVEKIEKFKNIARSLGYGSLKKKVNSKQLQDFLGSIKSDDSFLKTLLLRSMQKAIYSYENIGHYGLASEYYTHFTAPIRRYPDLIVHRLLRKYLFNHDINPRELTSLANWLIEASEHSSIKERDAIECEYEVLDLKKAEYMQYFLGERFVGVISSVNRFGLFIELDNTIEGLAHISKLKGRYIYDEKTLSLHGVNGTKYKLGDKVLIEVDRVNLRKREIDFKILSKIK